MQIDPLPEGVIYVYVICMWGMGKGIGIIYALSLDQLAYNDYDDAHRGANMIYRSDCMFRSTNIMDRIVRSTILTIIL